MALFLAGEVEKEGSPLAERGSLVDIARLLRAQPAAPGAADPVVELFLGERSPTLRRLAAQLLDLEGHPATAEVAALVLGDEAQVFLAPYLAYTRATHLDLLHIAPDPGAPPPALPSLRAAHAACGEAPLRELIAELGWPRVNLALDVRPRVGVSVNGSLPFFVAPAEAPLFESGEGARRVAECVLVVAHGGLPAERRAAAAGDDPVGRFRAYNLAHAEALGDILDLAPLTREKVQRILERMDRIVGDFVVLFSAHWSECAILPGLYAELRGRVVAELAQQESQPQLSAELTRLVQMFEDPGTLGEVRTLHGLKRFLHQQGLKLGFRLVEAGRATNRTVDLAVVAPKRPPRVVRRIGYVDFEPEEPVADASGPTGAAPAAAGAAMPYPVAALVDAFALQLLHGQESFPTVKIFCYGNEIHYYLAFGNHPAFLRVDYAPPLQGGMVDLEYYGVSKYVLGDHPNPELDALRLVFRRLDLDMQVESTRVHARYDKERVLDLGELCEKAEAVFRLVPYFMDLDWVIGDLDLPAEARAQVAEAWAERFERWGVLPVDQMLSRDRRGILQGVEDGPAGTREHLWTGQGAYRDRFTASPPASFFARLRRALGELELEFPPAREEDPAGFGQLPLERWVLRPVREALARGELVATAAGLRRAPAELFRREHEAEAFAELLAAGDAALLPSMQTALLVTAVERSLRFQTTGTVNGYEVQRAPLRLREGGLTLCALRDAAGIARLALFARGDALHRRRESAAQPWRHNRSTDAAALAAQLRRNSYLPPGSAPSQPDAADAAATGERFRRANPLARLKPLPGERLVAGLRASPGRAVGTATLGVAGRAPQDLDGAVLVASGMRPEDTPFLFRAAGIVSTGGGILSHAGLIAVQFRKPALVIPGRWLEGPGGAQQVVYRTLGYREEERAVAGLAVSLRRDLRESEHALREGDLLVLDADEGTLHVLGQDREALALHESFRLFAEANHRLGRATDESERLVLQGHKLRARHQLEKLLDRFTDPVLARHAAHEILLGEAFAEEAGAQAPKLQLLALLLANRHVAETTRDYLTRVARDLDRRHQASCEEALRRIPDSGAPHEVLAMRLEALRLREALDGVAGALHACGLEVVAARGAATWNLDTPARARLAALRGERLQAARAAAAAGGDVRLRHLLRQIERLDDVLGAREDEREPWRRMEAHAAHEDEAARRRLEARHVLAHGQCGFELFAEAGWKAANLGEVERLLGGGRVPPWFVVTHRAFEQALQAPLPPEARDGLPAGAGRLGQAIEAVVARADLALAQKSARIRALWDAAPLPDAIADEVAAAYRELGDGAPAALESGPGAADAADAGATFVAVRSSAREEDTEVAARAGEFDTFLFVRGEAQVLAHLKRAWSGLWNERALHNRAVLGTGAERVGGGVIVQRIVAARASGVLQTVNLAEGELREIVVNVGLGLGEGVVSGTVAADQVVVAKEGDPERDALRFRYLTADKRERVVFNRRAGFGTTRVECLYHQRMRPALEYTELCELVRAALRLEAAYGYPLDIEFAIEGTRLWILQARPVAAFRTVLRETLERYPLSGSPASRRNVPAEETRR
jgi:pyruvate,water dikinase